MHPLSGKEFRVTSLTLGIGSTGNHRVVITIPTAALIEVVSGPRKDDRRMVDVVWEGRPLRMFAQDIRDHCQRIFDEAVHS